MFECVWPFCGVGAESVKSCLSQGRPLKNTIQSTKIKINHFNQRIMEFDQWSFMPIIFTMNGGIAGECKVFYSKTSFITIN